ncbi:LysR family transcriptional regulator [Klebsiella indica]|uniref:LysR family transcriptional regulator n=1 Tax=Klebsiella indica TaxID=2582917 RepID=A0A5R9LES3_9ENTR|nr:LysR family transcriptional regulator [Klebsiella indica]TLV14002.1 LysR family transcriptional regulator [Klebsiella indica]
MKNELSGMKAFVTIAELGSFSKAAESLNLTQPALTKKIKKIESNLNIALFERTTRKIALTQAGKALLPKAKSLISNLDAAIFNLSNLTSQLHDTVTLSCIPTAVFYFLPRAIIQFNQRYPNIKVRIYEQGVETCLNSVRKGNVDFGINMNFVTYPDVDFIPLLNEPFVLVCRQNHPLATRKLVEWQELVNQTLIGVRRSSVNRQLIEKCLADKPWRLDWFYEVRHLSTSLGLVEAGLGVSALPCLAMSHNANNKVVSIPLVEPVIRRTLGMIRAKNRPLSEASERFASLLLLMWTNEAGTLWRNVVDSNQNT